MRDERMKFDFDPSEPTLYTIETLYTRIEAEAAKGLEDEKTGKPSYELMLPALQDAMRRVMYHIPQDEIDGLRDIWSDAKIRKTDDDYLAFKAETELRYNRLYAEIDKVAEKFRLKQEHNS